MPNLKTRVARIAEATLAARGFVTPVDVLLGLGWLAQSNVDRWQWGRVTTLDRCIGVDGPKTVEALETLRTWALERGLHAWDTDYGELLFTVGADPVAEHTFRTRWASAAQPAPAAPRKPPTRLTVIAALNAWTCVRCNESGDLLLKGESGGVCLDCADLGHLVFLPSGDAALTRRARKASRLSAVVVRWNVRRNRYERQGIMAENDAIEQAAAQCLEDSDVRAANRDRDRSRRAATDVEFRDRFAAAIREQFPRCPPARASAIAAHAALRGSGRVGRSAAGRDLDPDAIRLAVTASVRHVDTEYDDLLMVGLDRDEARLRVRDRVDEIMAAWRDGVAPLD